MTQEELGKLIGVQEHKYQNTENNTICYSWNNFESFSALKAKVNFFNVEILETGNVKIAG
jgi:hypothetical protein